MEKYPAILFFGLLDAKIRKQIILNTKTEGLLTDELYTTTHNSLAGAFIWGASPEGYEYWCAIYNDLKIQESEVA